MLLSMKCLGQGWASRRLRRRKEDPGRGERENEGHRLRKVFLSVRAFPPGSLRGPDPIAQIPCQLASCRREALGGGEEEAPPCISRTRRISPAAAPPSAQPAAAPPQPCRSCCYSPLFVFCALRLPSCSLRLTPVWVSQATGPSLGLPTQCNHFPALDFEIPTLVSGFPNRRWGSLVLHVCFHSYVTRYPTETHHTWERNVKNFRQRRKVLVFKLHPCFFQGGEKEPGENG